MWTSGTPGTGGEEELTLGSCLLPQHKTTPHCLLTVLKEICLRPGNDSGTGMSPCFPCHPPKSPGHSGHQSWVNELSLHPLYPAIQGSSDSCEYSSHTKKAVVPSTRHCYIVTFSSFSSFLIQREDYHIHLCMLRLREKQSVHQIIGKVILQAVCYLMSPELVSLPEVSFPLVIRASAS